MPASSRSFSSLLARIALAVAVASTTLACPGKSTPEVPEQITIDAAPPAVEAPTGPITIAVIGTSDLHGRVLGDDDRAGLPLFATYMKILREHMAAQGNGVLLVDAGDAFQGTLESGLNEGKVVVEAYNLLGYQAMAVGNHEFDFGPVGKHATPKTADEDPRGALQARAAEADFPFLAANLIDDATGKPMDYPNVTPTTLVEVAGVKIGIIGVTTWDTLNVTMATNVVGLSVTPLEKEIALHSRLLRAEGATAIVVLAHAGGKCGEFDDPHDDSSCDHWQEINYVTSKLPPGLVDVIVAGHTHVAIAHYLNGTPVIESWSKGHAFGRVDLTIDRETGEVTDTMIHHYEVVRPTEYLGTKITPDPAMVALLQPWLDTAKEARADELGPTLGETFTRSRDVESPVGNLFADLMREARGSDVALTNGGGLREDLPAGKLTYGQLYNASPFDNLFATMTLTGKQLRELIGVNLTTPGGIFSLSGVRATAACKNGALDVTLVRDAANSNKPIRDTDKLTLATNNFLATGGDAIFAAVPPESIVIDEETPPIRDVMAELLRGKQGPLEPDDYYDPQRPRIAYSGERPIKCPAGN